MKKLKKLLALLTAAAMLAAGSAIPVFAEDTDEVSEDTVVQMLDAEENVDGEAEEAVEDEETEEAFEADEEAEEAYEVELMSTTSLPAADGGVITLTEDTEVDLSGGTLALGDTYINAGSYSLTISNGAISGTGTYAIYTDTGAVTLDGVTVTLNQDVTATGTTAIKYYGIYSEISGAVTLQNNSSISLTPTVSTNVSIKNVYAYGIYSAGSGDISVTNSSVTVNTTLTNSGNMAYAYSYCIDSIGTGNVTVSGSTISASSDVTAKKTAKEYAYGINNGSTTASTGGTGTVTVSGSSISLDADTNAYGVAAGGDVSISGGSVTVTSSGTSSEGVRANNGSSISVSGAEITVNVGQYGLYTRGDITLTDSTVSVTSTSGVNAVYCGGTGEMNISGSTITATTNPSTTPTTSLAVGVYTNGGSVTVESSDIDAVGTTADRGIQSTSGSTVTFNSGTVTADSGIYSETSTVTVNGGTITGTTYGIYAIGGTTAVTGGTITADEYGIHASGSDVTISSADENNLTSVTGSTALYASSATVIVEESGCDMSGSITSVGADITLYGGTYSSDVDEYAATNYYQDSTGEVVLSNTIVTDNDYLTNADGSTTTITLTNLEDNVDNYIDNSETATIEVVLSDAGDDDTTALSNYFSTYEIETADDGFAVDISVIKTTSAGVVTDITEISNQEVTITLPTAVADETTTTIYHVKDSTTPTIETITPDNVSGNTVTFTTSSFSTYYIDYTAAQISSLDITDKVTLNLTPTATNVQGEYYITLDAEDDEYINRFMAAELAFELDDTLDITNIGAVTITPASYIDIIDNGDGEYEFNVNGDENSGGETISDISGASILLGTLTITGDGTFKLTLKTDNLSTNTANQVQTAETSNNIVSTYNVDGTADGELLYNTTALASGKLTLAQSKLIINVMFPNAVTAQNAEYNDMKITVTGIGVDEEIEIGKDKQTDGLQTVTISGVDSNNDYTATGYVATIDDVYTGYSYTLEFTGAGYRTYRMTVVPDGDSATVTVWNNAMSNDMVVVSSDENAMGAVTDDVTFLAGDIVANDLIDLWDLSAVVSYFGKTNDTTTADTFAMYDLNRDGKVDSRDIAMVLVSWDY
ncbi:MAG: dockerin type I domain-containing protein [Firmicutes bacterium]|nr:dockerin type I domain-containing protein [Bacillota bacterium]